ncbi:hypothetical protein K8R66_00795, partial [bacterium]|nr:hypothetical protein [bacterium]
VGGIMGKRMIINGIIFAIIGFLVGILMYWYVAEYPSNYLAIKNPTFLDCCFCGLILGVAFLIIGFVVSFSVEINNKKEEL